MERKDLKKVTGIASSLWLFWWVNAHTKEGYTWLKKAWEIQKEEPQDLDEYTFALLATNVGTMAFLQRDFVTYSESLVQNNDLIMRQKDDELLATATLITGVVKTIMQDYGAADKVLQTSHKLFKKTGSNTGISLSLSALGRNSIYSGQTTKAKEYYQKSIEIARAENNEFSVIIGLAGFALAEVMERNTNAKNYLRESLLLSQSLHFYEALAWSIEIWALVSLTENKVMHAVTLMGAVDNLRTTTQLPIWEDLQAIILNAKKQVQEQMDPAIFDKAWNDGVLMSIDQMVNYAMEG
jgi:tetratricopeptide (TPR) repeat protein